MVTGIVIDTSAMIEYFDATGKGRAVKEIIEDQKNVVFIPSVVFCELASKLTRQGFDAEKLLLELSAFVARVDVSESGWVNAGKKHAALKKLEKRISLVDCIVMQIGEEHGNALILAADNHFKHYKNAKIL